MVKRERTHNFVPVDHPDADVRMRQRAMNLANAAAQTRAGHHCPTCAFTSHSVVQLAHHILHDHLQTSPASIEGNSQ
jgi:hypothetical protein